MGAIASQITSLARECFLSRLIRRRSKKTSKLHVTGLCAGNSPETGEFPTQRSSNAETVSIWWRHHEFFATHGPWLMLWKVTYFYSLNSQFVSLHRFLIMMKLWTLLYLVNKFLELTRVIAFYWDSPKKQCITFKRADFLKCHRNLNPKFEQTVVIFCIFVKS